MSFISVSMFSQYIETDFTELKYMTDSVEISKSGGKVIVHHDTKLHDLMTNYSNAYKLKPDKVFRVQIYFGIGRQARYTAQSVKRKFEQKHPNIQTVLVFEEPYFKVKVGDFDLKLDAEKLRNQLQHEYTSVFITEDVKN